MKRTLLFYSYCLGSLLLLTTACRHHSEPEPALDGDAVPLEGIQATLDSDSPARAGEVLTVGRADFVPGDLLQFSTIKRTASPLAAFTYSDVVWRRNAAGGWERTDSGNKIYWSDAQNPHTFIGFARPQQQGDRVFKWERPATLGGVENQFYYGELGDPTAPEVDYTSGNEALQQVDLALTYSTNTVAQPGGSIALVRFRHALSRLRIVVALDDYSAGTDAQDNKATVDKMEVPGQPVHYKWTTLNAEATPLGETEESLVYGSRTAATKTVKLWNTVPEGIGAAQEKQFVFESIVVPGVRESLVMNFQVTTPDPMVPRDPTKYQTKDYRATMANVTLKPGVCTTVHISLNHRSESMTIGAEYVNWKYQATPDDGELFKESTFLSSMDASQLTLSNAATRVEDATWLFDNQGNLVDIYGNPGTEAQPYLINNAAQLLAFAQEVNTLGNTFQGKYIRLNASLHLQPSTSLPASKSQYLKWKGIGSATTPFEGILLGNNHYISLLYGEPFFKYIGKQGGVSELRLTNCLGIKGGGGIVEYNGGILCSCRVEGDIEAEEAYCGSLAAENTGIIFGCVHLGNITGPNNVGGLIGKNSKYVVASYHAGAITATDPDGHTAGGAVENTAEDKFIGCFYDSSLATPTDHHGSIDKTTDEMQSAALTGIYQADAEGTVSLNGSIFKFVTGDTGFHENLLTHFRNHRFIYHPADYPTMKAE